MEHLQANGLDLIDYLLTACDEETLDEELTKNSFGHSDTICQNYITLESTEPHQNPSESNTLISKDEEIEKCLQYNGDVFQDNLLEHNTEKRLDLIEKRKGGKINENGLSHTNENQQPLGGQTQEDCFNDPGKGETKKVMSKQTERIPCMVCRGVSSGCHFGVISCESCKVFFRRNLSKKSPYVCNSENNCTIRPGRHASCSACRLKKCLSLGMAKEKAKKGRYTTERRKSYQTLIEEIDNERKKKTEEEKRKKKSHQQRMEETIARLRFVHLKHLEQNDELIEKIAAQKLSHRKTMESIVGPFPDTSPTEIHNFYRSTGVDLSGLKDFVKKCMSCWEHGALQFVNYAKDLEEFMELSLHDRVILLKGALQDCFVVTGNYMNAEYEMVVCARCGSCVSEDEYRFFGNPSDFKQQFRPRAILQSLNLTHEETAVLRAFVIFDSSHFIDTEPEDQDKIDKTQYHLMNCLLYVLQTNRGQENGNRVYANIIRALTENRTQHYLTIQNRELAAQVMSDIKCSKFLAEMYQFPDSSVEDLGNEMSLLNIA